MNKKVITMGEILLRLSTPNYKRFDQSDILESTYGGGEANVAVSLAQFDLNSYFVTRLPENPFGQNAMSVLSRYGVKDDYVSWGGQRMGIYYLETGTSMRSSNVVYDRKNSAIAEASEKYFNFDEIFEDASWFHFSGITPALSVQSAKLTLEALKAAKEHGVTVSVDINYRKKLWQPERAKQVMEELMSYVDVCIDPMGLRPSITNAMKDEFTENDFKTHLKEIYTAYNFKYVVTTRRKCLSASDHKWSALAYDGSEFLNSKHYDLRIVDRVGGGDSFAAGLIYGLLDESKDNREALEFAVAASALKHTVKGDLNLSTVSEIEDLMHGNALGRIER